MIPILTLPAGLPLAICASLLPYTMSAQDGVPDRLTAPGSSEAQLAIGLRRSLEHLDPSLGSWETEVLHKDVQARMDLAIRAALEGDEEWANGEEGLAPKFESESWTGPYQLGLFEGATLTADALPPLTVSPAPEGLPAEIFLAASKDLRHRLGNAATVRSQVKVLEVRLDANQVTASVQATLVQPVAEDTAPRSLQVHFDWTVTFTRSPDGLLLRSIRSHNSAEIASGPPASTPLFADITRAALGDDLVDLQFGPSLQHWRNRLDASLEPGLLGHHGIAIGDVDGNGLEDIYVCQPGGLPNRLLLRQPSGTAIDVAARAGVDLIDASQSALIVDLDADGSQDLIVAAAARLLLFRGSGTGEFSAPLVFAAPGVTSLAVADTDQDGDLDIFACGYASPYDRAGIPEPYHDAENGQRNLYLRNDGRGSYIDATVQVGLDEGGRRFSLAAAFEDYDNDGDQDLYVANDFGRNALYRNDAGYFTNVAAELGVEDIGAGMGVDWADVNGDGWMDLLVSNMFSSAGQRIGALDRFHGDAPDAERSDFRKHARGNSLFQNQGGERFLDVSEAAHITGGRWAWGAVFLDIQNDGWPDIFVPNGFVTGERTKDL